MTAGLEPMTVTEWVVATLRADPTLAGLATVGSAVGLDERVVDGEYKGPDVPWWISFTVTESLDVYGVGLIQIMAAVPFQVKVVGPVEDYGTLLPIYQRVHALLEAQINQVATNGLVLSSKRVGAFQFPERVNGMEYRHLGGRYETLTQ